VLASGTPEDVSKAVKEMIAGVEDKTRFVLSCGGGMPPAVDTANIKAFIQSAEG